MSGIILIPSSDARFAGRNFLHLKTVDSTNSFCLENPDILSSPGLVVYADLQHSGRGRMGRCWNQGAGGHLFCSFVIHPELPSALLPSITICTGLAVYRALTAMGVEDCSLKWPNDLLIKGKKVCGILCESQLLQQNMTVVSGVGVNISGTSKQFPEEISHAVTTLEECGICSDRDTVLKNITLSLDEILKALHSGNSRALFREWEEASSSHGRMVRFGKVPDCAQGTVDGLDDYGRLVVRDAKGNLRTVISGEVEYI